MLDDAMAARIKEIGVEVCMRLGLDVHPYKKYHELLESEIVKWETRKVLARMEQSYDAQPYEPMGMITDKNDDDEGMDCTWKATTPNF
jgi:hypothetical protein